MCCLVSYYKTSYNNKKCLLEVSVYLLKDEKPEQKCVVIEWFSNINSSQSNAVMKSRDKILWNMQHLGAEEKVI